MTAAATSEAPLNVLICGAGIAGLSTAIAIAHRCQVEGRGASVTILDEAHALSPVGAGIHIPPNASRLLGGWGLLEALGQYAVAPDGVNFRRHDTGDVIARAPAPAKLDGAPYWSIKRADYQQVLLDAAIELGCKLRLAAKVVDCDEGAPSVTLQGGETLMADLIIAADGIRSRLRQAVIPEEEIDLIVNPLASYRSTIAAEDVAADPLTAPLLEKLRTECYMGYRRHVILYPIANGTRLAIGGTRPGKFGVGEWNRNMDPTGLADEFAGFTPVVKALLAKIDEGKQFTLAEVPQLPRWVSRSGRVVLVGDSAHAMLPFLAQGGAMAIEDAAALGECLGRVKSAQDVGTATRAFERIRKWRAETVARHTRRNGDMIHMADGEEQEERDRIMSGQASSPASDEQVLRADVGPWLDAPFQAWLMRYDAVKEANRHLDTAF